VTETTQASSSLRRNGLPALRRRRPPSLRKLDRDAIDIAEIPVQKLLGK
jgi:hypothetical protein